ncbi:MAG: DNA translocase FtsK 4TM domain-containing protein, partial [Planctomycetota bacterium]
MNNEECRESRAIITGLGLVCFALFAGVSLYSHSPYDVLDYHAAQSQEIQNKGGLVGAQLAHHAFCLYGAGAWVLTVLMLLCGSWICAVRSMSGFLAKVCGSLLLTCLVCTWAAALGNNTQGSESFPAGPGGLLGGTFLAPPLVSYFGHVGVFMLLATAGLLCSLLLAPVLTEVLLSVVGRGVVGGSQWFANWVLGRVQSTPDFVPAEAALAAVDAGAGAQGAAGRANARVTVLPLAATRRNRLLLGGPVDEDEDEDGALSDRARRLKAARKAEEDESGEQTEGRRFDNDDEGLRRERKAKDEEEELTDEEESELRRQEALRQVEAADADRLEREKQAREQAHKALEKLEKERAGQEQQRAKQQEKFAAVIAEAAVPAAASPPAQEALAEAAETDPSAPPPKPKPKLPEKYDLPQYDLLIANDVTPEITSEMLKERGMTVIQTLWDFKIESKLVAEHRGPTVTMYEVELAPGVKVCRVVALQDNLAIALKAGNGVRVVYPIPGKNTIGIEIPNNEEHTVRM